MILDLMNCLDVQGLYLSLWFLGSFKTLWCHSYSLVYRCGDFNKVFSLRLLFMGSASQTSGGKIIM